MKTLNNLIRCHYKYGIHVKIDFNILINIKIKLSLIIAGAERFRAITISHLRNADGAFIVYDLTNEQSFINIEYWHEQIKLSSNDDIVIYLLANKKDLQKDRVVDSMRGLNKAKNRKMNKFIEVSAKTKENLMETFKEFYMEIYQKNKKKLLEKRNKNLKVFETMKKEENNACC